MITDVLVEVVRCVLDNLYQTGIRPLIDQHLDNLAKEERDYGDYWSASSAGYCMRLNILRRLKVPPIPELADDKRRQQRVFSAGHVFHEWIQKLTKDAGLSIASEVELQDEDLMIRGHFDDLILLKEPYYDQEAEENGSMVAIDFKSRLILYDYKTVNSQAFNYKRDNIGHYHRMQLGTYMYMLRKNGLIKFTEKLDGTGLTEARIMNISKDDLRMSEVQLLWDSKLEKDVVSYWTTLNGYWKARTLPRCTCLNHDGGFMGKRSKKGKIYNDYMLNDIPCNLEWVNQHKELMKGWSRERN